jgi:hypothetical protein
MKKSKVVLFLTLTIILLFGCKAEKVTFELKGCNALVSINEGQEAKLLLLNIDTEKQLEINYNDNINKSSFQLFNQCNNIFVDPHNSSYFINFKIAERDAEKVYYHEQNEFPLQEYNTCIYNDIIYVSNESKIISYALSNFQIIKEFETDLNIYEFDVIAENKFVVVGYFFANESSNIQFSDITIYDYNIPFQKSNLSIQGHRIKSSRSGNYFYFRNGVQHYLYIVQKSITKQLGGLSSDSLNVIGQAYFIDENSLIFVGQKNGEILDSRSLYLYSLETDKIFRQIFRDGSIEEIKSTYYSATAN